MTAETNEGYLVCALASEHAYFADDEYGNCCRCDERVRVRPHASKTAKRICLSCAMPRLAEAMAKGQLNAVVTEQSVREAALFFAKAGGKA